MINALHLLWIIPLTATLVACICFILKNSADLSKYSDGLNDGYKCGYDRGYKRGYKVARQMYNNFRETYNKEET